MAKPVQKVRVIHEMTLQFKACCSGVAVGTVGKILPRTPHVPEGKEFVQFSAKSLGYSGRELFRVYIEKEFLEML